MYTLEKYAKDLKILAGSIMVKHDHIGVRMNAGLSAVGIVVPKNKKQWKYYLNLCGLPHATNNQVMIMLHETGKLVPLTKDVLIQNPVTLRELDLRTNFYNALISKYSDDVLYINGCITPNDINTITTVLDGTIVGYSKYYIEPQEFSLIRELTVWIRSYFSRWYITDYNITDELYMASVLGVLYANLPNVISGIRLEDIGTAETHSFHVEHFFRSHLDIWGSVSNLTSPTIWWLYRNLVYLMNHVGTEETFNLVLKHVFNPNGIGLANYELINTKPNEWFNTNIAAPVYTTNEPEINLKALNTYYLPITTTLTIAAGVTRELATHTNSVLPNAVMLPNIISTTKSKLSNTMGMPQNTKILDFGTISIFKAYSNSLLETILDNWLVAAKNGSYVTPMEYIDPNNKTSYILTPYIGVILFYYLLLIKLGDPDPSISSITHKNILKMSLTKKYLNEQLLNATGSQYVIDIIINKLPNNNSLIRNTADFGTIINAITDLYAELWSVDSNVNNVFLSANIKKLVSKVYTPGKVNIVNSGVTTNLKAFLLNAGVDIKINNTYNLDIAMASLFKLFTGFELKEETLIKEIYDGHKALLDKLTSYTVQTLTPDIKIGDAKIPYSTIAVNNSKSGYIAVTKANIIKILEDMKGIASGVGNNFITYTKTVNLDHPTVSMLDYQNSLMLVGKRGSVLSDLARVSLGGVRTELLLSSYVHYSPDTLGAGNNVLFKENSLAANYGSVNFPIAHQRLDTILSKSSNNSVSVTHAGSAQLVGHDYPVFSPNAVGSDANNVKSNTVTKTTNISAPASPVTVPGSSDVITKAVNASVTIQPNVTVAVSGGTYTKYAPNAVGSDANNVKSNTVNSGNSSNNNAVTATVVDPTIISKASNASATITVNTTTQVVGNNTKAP